MKEVERIWASKTGFRIAQAHILSVALHDPRSLRLVNPERATCAVVFSDSVAFNIIVWIGVDIRIIFHKDCNTVILIYLC